MIVVGEAAEAHVIAGEPSQVAHDCGTQHYTFSRVVLHACCLRHETDEIINAVRGGRLPCVHACGEVAVAEAVKALAIALRCLTHEVGVRCFLAVSPKDDRWGVPWWLRCMWCFESSPWFVSSVLCGSSCGTQLKCARTACLCCLLCSLRTTLMRAGVYLFYTCAIVQPKAESRTSRCELRRAIESRISHCRVAGYEPTCDSMYPTRWYFGGGVIMFAGAQAHEIRITGRVMYVLRYGLDGNLCNSNCRVPGCSFAVHPEVVEGEAGAGKRYRLALHVIALSEGASVA